MPNILLTGAGFSRNWGGWLAFELFEYLLGCPEIMRSSSLKRLMWQHQRRNGFESALAEVQRKYVLDHVTFHGDLMSMQQAIASAFGHMNRNFFEQRFEWTDGPIGRMTPFLARFDTLFTLNQDLLLEHHYDPMNHPSPLSGRWLGLQLPGMVTGAMPMPPKASGLARYAWVAAPAESYALTMEKQPLFKLHGSTGWSDNMHGSVMIMGENKASEINLFPILSWYFQWFEHFLQQPDTRLMVIGYGFRDIHVNEAIINAVMNHGLQFYVIDPAGSDLASRLNPTAAAPIPGSPTTLECAFETGLIGASRRSLREIFGSDNVEYSKVMRFFDR